MTTPRAVREAFLAELASAGLSATAGDDGLFVVATDAGSTTVSLDDIAREFAGHGDAERLARRLRRFVATLADPLAVLPASWEDAEPRVRWAVESASIDLGDTLGQQFSDQARLALVYVTPDEADVAFLTPDVAERWGQTQESLAFTAAANMARLVAGLSVHVEEFDGLRLGMFRTPDDFPAAAFKAAFLLSPTLKRIVEPVLGWPVFAVMPSRDFVYLVPHTDAALLPRLGATVIGEYHRSAYPVSKEVFEVGDEGIRAVSEFQAPPGVDPLDAAEGMRRVNHRGVVSFRVPSHWAEEPGEERVRYFDEDGEGSLELSVVTFRSDDPVDDDTLTELLGGRADETGGELLRLPSGDVCLHYESHAGDGDDEVVIWRWEVGTLVRPNHVRVAAFSYAVDAEAVDDEGVMETLGVLRRELTACAFAEGLVG